MTVMNAITLLSILFSLFELIQIGIRVLKKIIKKDIIITCKGQPVNCDIK